MIKSKGENAEGYHYDLTGPGPFELPFVAGFVGIDAPEGKDWFLALFQSEEGKILYLPVAYGALPGLADSLSALKSRRSSG